MSQSLSKLSSHASAIGGPMHMHWKVPTQSESAQSIMRSQSSSAPLPHTSSEAWHAQSGEPPQSLSSQSNAPSQSSSKPLTHNPASFIVQPHSSVPMQSVSRQSTVVSQSSSWPLPHASPPGAGVQPQFGTSSHTGSRQSATPLQSLSSASKQFSTAPGLVFGLWSLQSSPLHSNGANPSSSRSSGANTHRPVLASQVACSHGS